MIEYSTEPCNSLNREANFFGMPQTIFFLYVGSIVVGYVVYNIVNLLHISMLTIIVSVIEIIVYFGGFIYLSKKGSELNITEIQKKFVFNSRPHWIKAKV